MAARIIKGGLEENVVTGKFGPRAKLEFETFGQILSPFAINIDELVGAGLGNLNREGFRSFNRRGKRSIGRRTKRRENWWARLFWVVPSRFVKASPMVEAFFDPLF